MHVKNTFSCTPKMYALYHMHDIPLPQFFFKAVKMLLMFNQTWETLL